MDSLLVILGYAGVLFLLGGYFMVLNGHITPHDKHHILLNLLGSLFIVLAMYNGVVLPLLYVIVLWLVITVFGMFTHNTSSS